MTLMNLLYRVEACSQNPQSVCQPIQLRGAHQSRLHEAMISFYVGQIMEHPLEERESMILFASIMPDLKVTFLERLERASQKYEQIVHDLNHVYAMTIPPKAALENFKDMRYFHLDNVIKPIMDAIPAKKRGAIYYRDYIQTMKAISQDPILLKILHDWFSCCLDARDNLALFFSEKVDIPKIQFAMKLDNEKANLLAEGLKSTTTLKHLKIDRHVMTAERAVLIFSNGLQFNTSLMSLSIRINPIGDEGLEAIAKGLETHPSLTSLRLSDMDVSAIGVEKLAEALKGNRVLRRLMLTHYYSVRHLAEALRVNQALRYLNLRFGRICDKDLEIIAGALLENNTLSSLILNNNEISSKGARHLAEALEKNQSLEHLDLWGNRIGDVGALAFASMMKVNSTLTSLIVRHNGIGPVGFDELKAIQTLYPNRHIDFLDPFLDKSSK